MATKIFQHEYGQAIIISLKQKELNFYNIQEKYLKNTRYLRELMIYSKYRNRGYGSILLEECKSWCIKRNYILALDAIPLDSTHEYFYDIETLVQFYEKRGFIRCSDGTEMVFNNKD